MGMDIDDVFGRGMKRLAPFKRPRSTGHMIPKFYSSQIDTACLYVLDVVNTYSGMSHQPFLNLTLEPAI